MRIDTGTLPIDAGGPAVDMRLARELGEPLRLRRGIELYRQGSVGCEVFVVVTGAIELWHTTGRGRVPVALVGPARIAGGLDALTGLPRCCTARVQVSTAAIRVSGDRLADAMARHGSVCARWLVAAHHELRDAHTRIALLAERSVLVQVAQLLLGCCDPTGCVSLTQAAVAARLARSRQSINEAVHHLRELGIVETSYRSIFVIDASRLALVAAGDEPPNR